MNAHLFGGNLLAYSLQVALIVLAAAPVPFITRMRAPRARLLFWHVVLAVCLLLPVLEPWRGGFIVVDSPALIAPMVSVAVTPAAAPIPWTRIALGLLALGIALRATWLGLGLLRLRRYRRASVPLTDLSPELAELRIAFAPDASLLLSDRIASPVTFGLRAPVVLLPVNFPDLAPTQQQAIVCHELLHVMRRDWMIAVAEEAVRALLWFHPAVWWLLGRIHLSREQTVDREVITILASPHDYVDALLAIAGARPALDLAPAPLFLRRRHLTQRVFSILKEGNMSQVRWISALATGLGILTFSCWLAAGQFPLKTAPLLVADSTGVTVDIGQAALAHRTGVEYPAEARAAGIQGRVTLEVSLASDGTVNDARVISGPDELRRSSLQSVLQWHFDKNGAPGVKQVSIVYALPPAPPAAASAAPVAGAAAAKPAVAVPQRTGRMFPPNVELAVLKRINITGLSSASEAELRAKLAAWEGASITPDTLKEMLQTVREFDRHLSIVGLSFTGSDKKEFEISFAATGWQSSPASGGVLGGIVGSLPAGVVPAPPPANAEQFATLPDRIRVGGNAQSLKLVNKVRPEYPPLAKQARIQGVVKFTALIDKEGHISNISVLSGHPLLVSAALEAVKQWTYETTLLNGNPVEVITQIDVNFTLTE